MNLENCILIIDEAQNLNRLNLRSILSRCCDNVKAIVLGDINQIDNAYLNKWNNGLNWVVKSFFDAPNYAHLVLKGNKSRGPITDLVIKSGL
jgi:PhoH-like ATPase